MSTSARARRTPVSWVRAGGLTTLLFLLPILLVFGVFSWYPIVAHGDHVAAGDEPRRSRRRGSASTTSGAVLNDPLLPTAVKNTAVFAGLALVFGYPIPLMPPC